MVKIISLETKTTGKGIVLVTSRFSTLSRPPLSFFQMKAGLGSGLGAGRGETRFLEFNGF